MEVKSCSICLFVTGLFHLTYLQGSVLSLSHFEFPITYKWIYYNLHVSLRTGSDEVKSPFKIRIQSSNSDHAILLKIANGVSQEKAQISQSIYKVFHFLPQLTLLFTVRDYHTRHNFPEPPCWLCCRPSAAATSTAHSRSCLKPQLRHHHCRGTSAPTSPYPQGSWNSTSPRPHPSPS